MRYYLIKYQNRYLKVQNNCVIWTAKEYANKYTSKYQAKRHMQMLGIEKNESYSLEEV